MRMNVRTVADAPPIETTDMSVRPAPATVPLTVLPAAVGEQNTSVLAVNSACVMYCTVTDDTSPAPATTYANPPPLLPMVNV